MKRECMLPTLGNFLPFAIQKFSAIATMRTLIFANEYFDPDFCYSPVIYRENGDYFITKLPTRIFIPHKLEVDPNAIDAGIRIPLEAICQPVPSHLLATALVAPTPLPKDTYVKSIESMLQGFSSRGNTLGVMLIEELQVYESLRRQFQPYPPFLCEYRGYITDDAGRVTGLALKKYQSTLKELVLFSGLPFDRVAIMDECRHVVSKLHSIGLVHNDINPSNIMFDTDGSLVLIDLATMAAEGVVTGIIGTTHFSRFCERSEKENDYFSLSCIDLFLKEGYGMMRG